MIEPISVATPPIMLTAKRNRVTDTELEELEHCAKKHIKNMQASKSCQIFAAPLLDAGRKIAGAKEHLQTLKIAHTKLTNNVRELRGASVIAAEAIRQSALEGAKEALSTLNQLEVGVEVDMLRGVVSAYLQPDGDLPSLEVVLPKMEYYKHNPKDLPKEVRDLNNILKPVLVLDDEAEILMNAFRRAFDKASSALCKVQEATTDAPLTDADVAVYANYLNGQLDAIVCQFAAKEDLQKMASALEEQRYIDLFESELCLLCCEHRADVSVCQSCSAKMCSSCFGDQLIMAAEDGWTDVSMITRLATLSCGFCKIGTFDAVIRQQLPSDAAELYVQAVERNARTDTARDARIEKRREQRAYRALPNKKEKQYQIEKRALVDMLGIQCPECAIPFADYDGCCSLQCSSCSTWFCALCFDHGSGSWSRSLCHSHVKDCKDRPADMDDEHFYPLHLWKKHTAIRQHKLCSKYLEKTDLSRALKSRLLCFDFPCP